MVNPKVTFFEALKCGPNVTYRIIAASQRQWHIDYDKEGAQTIPIAVLEFKINRCMR